MQRVPTRIEPHGATEILMAWQSGDAYVVPYVELRYYCPCAGCVDEHTGKRTLQRETIEPGIRPVSVTPVGRYAVQVAFSDRHDTGIFHFDTLWSLCTAKGRRLDS